MKAVAVVFLSLLGLFWFSQLRKVNGKQHGISALEKEVTRPYRIGI